ncbi:transaldolase, partial [Candidatus Saccharibacteria bacterium]|nr:transaldolase [Candidatus Saccharibacteria bacterium]
MNPLVELQAYGQSFWYDNIRRKFLNDGTLQNLIDEDGLRGMTSNPSIFEKAIGQSDDYDEQIKQEVQAGKDV